MLNQPIPETNPSSHRPPRTFNDCWGIPQKTLVNIQTSASSPSPFTNIGPYLFGAQAPSAATLTPPGLPASSLVFNSSKSDYGLNGGFASKAALDAAFPNGSYRMSGGFPTLTINVAGDLYPIVPQVTGGTWQNGVLVIDPSQSNTLNINTFTGYASSGVGGYMEIKITSETGNDNVALDQTFSTAGLAGATVSPAPFTSYMIPAHTLTAGLAYQMQLT